MKTWKVIFAKNNLFAAVLGSLMVGLTVPAQADLIEVDLVSGSGDKLITRDTLANLDWLDLSESLGRNFNDVSTQFGIGGDFEGWRLLRVQVLKVSG